MTAAERLLVGILAASDAIWRPLRAVDWSGRMPTVLYELQSGFRRSGFPWRTSDPSTAGRKAHERCITGMAAAGLVQTFGRDRRTQVRLTDRGDRTARAMADLPNVDAGLATVREVERLGGGKVSELLLAGLPDYIDSPECRAELWVVECLALPALCRQWLESGSDCFGRTWYWTTDVGRNAAAAMCQELGELPSASNEAAQVYDEERTAYRDDLRSRAPAIVREIGLLPMSCSTPLHAATA